MGYTGRRGRISSRGLRLLGCTCKSMCDKKHTNIMSSDQVNLLGNAPTSLMQCNATATGNGTMR
eukprot:7696294-Lingulodinium_polyedra.AAC.1